MKPPNEKDTPCYQCITFPICKVYVHSFLETKTPCMYPLFKYKCLEGKKCEMSNLHKEANFCDSINSLTHKCRLIADYVSRLDIIFNHNKIQRYRVSCLKKVYGINEKT